MAPITIIIIIEMHVMDNGRRESSINTTINADLIVILQIIAAAV